MTVGPHPDNDVLADFVEGLLPHDDAVSVHDHLRACGSCQAVVDSLAELRLVLRDAGAQPAPMPSAVADRLEALISAESAARRFETAGGVAPQDTALPTTAPSPTAAPVSGLGRARSSSRRGARRAERKRPRWVPALAAAASVAALGLGGGAIYSALSDTGTPTAQRSGPSASAGTPRDGTTTFGFRPDATANLTAGDFAGQVDALIEPKTSPSPSPSKSFRVRNNPGVAGPDPNARCVSQLLDDAKAGKVLATKPAKLDGEVVTLALTETGKPGVIRVYAIRCGTKPEIARTANISPR